MENVGIALVLALVYCVYQLVRNIRISEIRQEWIIERDEKFNKYTHEQMFLPSFSNWFGLKFPLKRDF